MFNNHKKKLEVSAHDVIDIVRLLGHIGMRFEFTDEYVKVSDTESTRKERYRMFIIYGSRKQLAEFNNLRNIILQYHLH